MAEKYIMSNIWHLERGPMGPSSYQKNITYYLLTKSEVITAKSQTEALMY